MIAVLDAGLRTTIQDLGRPGHAHLGVSAAGAADSVSLRIGNRLVGNADGAAALELTLLGGSFRFERAATVAVTGSDFAAVIELGSGVRRPLPRWEGARVESGEVLRMGATRSGARAYLCVAGGIDTPLVLGSRSTHLPSGLGGIDGSVVRAGQLLPVGPVGPDPPGRLRVPAADVEACVFRKELRVTAGTQAGSFPLVERDRFHATAWEVSESADRSGLRLVGPPLAAAGLTAARTEGVFAGSVQVPGDGRPILLFVDQQTTGGYPKIAAVISADLPSAGQLRPRDRIRFVEVALHSAHAALFAQERFLSEAVAVA